MRRYDPFQELRRLQEEMDRVMAGIWGKDEYLALPGPEDKSLPTAVREPVTDMKETDKEIITHMEIPGVDKKDIKLNITEDGIEVQVEKKTEKKEEREGYIRMESGYRSFYRRIPFPEKVDPEKADAKYEKGILEVTVPKTAETKKKKQIEVK